MSVILTFLNAGDLYFNDDVSGLTVDAAPLLIWVSFIR